MLIYAVSAAHLVLSASDYSSMTDRLPIHLSISSCRQPIERESGLPSLTGAGKSPLRTRRQIVVFDSPVALTTSGVLSILSIWNLLLWGASCAQHSC